MRKRQRLSIFALLITGAVVAGMLLPIYLNSRMDLQDPFFATPLPTSTRFRAPLSDIMDVFSVPTGEPEIEENATTCTYPAHYWQDHPDSWPAQIVISGGVYGKEEVRALYGRENPDTNARLTMQLYTTFLNILHGADLSVIESTILDASVWLNENPQGSDLSEFNQQRGEYLARLLENYNNGLIGPGACEDAPGTPTPLTPTLTFTPAPPASASTGTPATGGFGQPRPTNTPSTTPPPPPPASTPTADVPTASPVPSFTPTTEVTPTAPPPSPTLAARTATPVATTPAPPAPTNTPNTPPGQTLRPPTNTPRPPAPTATPTLPPPPTPTSPLLPTATDPPPTPTLPPPPTPTDPPPPTATDPPPPTDPPEPTATDPPPPTDPPDPTEPPDPTATSPPPPTPTDPPDPTEPPPTATGPPASHTYRGNNPGSHRTTGIRGKINTNLIF